MAHLHHFHPSVCGLNLGSLCTRSPGPRFHYSELHKQITGALLKCRNRLLIDNECRLGCLLGSMHHVLLAHGSASYAPLPRWPTHLPAALCSPTNTRTKKTHTVIHPVCSRSAPLSWIETFDYAVKSPRMPRQEKEFIVKNPSTGWLCHRKLVIQIAPLQTQSDTDGSLIWAEMLSRAYLKRGADNDWVWRRDEQRNLVEGDVDWNGGKTVRVGGQIQPQDI